jgi:hypothetical protein
MMNANVNVIFRKCSSSLTYNGTILAHGDKVNNLFTYMALTPPRPPTEHARISYEPVEIILMHHRLAHTSYSTIESMRRLNTAKKFSPNVHHGTIPQCVDCPYGKQIRAPFKKTEDLPDHIGDVIASDVCGPFEPSIGGG